MSSGLYSGQPGLSLGTGLYRAVSSLWSGASGFVTGWGAFSPASLFAAGEQGAWYDPSDLTTMFQDTAGTTPVTATGQTVGLLLDKSKGLVLGPELVTNGTFDTSLTGWSVTNVVWSSGAASFTGVPSLVQSMATTSGTTYRVTITVSGLVGGLLWLRFVGGTASNSSSFGNGVNTFLMRSNGNTALLIEQFSGTITAGTIDNISVRELPGNHATQSVLASRPILAREPLGGRRNLLTWTEQFDNAAWSKTNVSFSGFTATASSTGHLVSQEVTVVPGQTYTFSFYAQRGTMTDVKYSVFNLSGTSNIIAPTSYYSQINANSLTRVSFSFTTPAGCTSVRIYPLRDSGVTGTVILGGIGFGAQLETGSTATAYQRVTSVYDVTEAGKADLHYLLFDGSDDFLVRNTITPGTDKAQVFAGVRKLSDAVGTIIEHSAALVSNAGSFNLSNRDWTASTGAKWFWASRGSAAVPTAAEVAASGAATAILSGIGDIAADTAILRANGSQVASSTADQGTGNYLAYPAYIGRRGGTTLPFNGSLYGLIARFGPNLSDVQIAQTEQWLNQKTGAY